jgi:hypothetical protein
MKTTIIEKNGFLKPLGMLLIIIILSLTCFVNLVFAEDTSKSNPVFMTDETEDAVESTEINSRTFTLYRIGL